MGTDSNLRTFLRSRRAAIDPAAVGLPPSPVPRRGRGLRREEVASLAGVSVDYYARLEQGRIGQVSHQVLTAIENALQLDPLEREHFRTLVAPAPPRARPDRPATTHVRTSVRDLIDGMDPIPALLQGPRTEVLATNRAARVLLTDFDALPVSERNIARWLFLDRSTRTRYPQWEEVAGSTVAALRANRDPRIRDDALESLVRDLTAASADFARFWSVYRLFEHSHGRKQIFHDSVGILTLNYETLHLPDDTFISTYTADRGSPSEERLRRLLDTP